MTLKEQILEFVTQRGRVRLSDIEQRFAEARGELSWESRNFKNVVFWRNLSREAIDALEDLLEQRQSLCTG